MDPPQLQLLQAEFHRRYITPELTKKRNRVPAASKWCCSTALFPCGVLAPKFA